MYEQLERTIRELEGQKRQLLKDIENAEAKLETIHKAQVNGKIILPCQTQVHINPEWSLKCDPNWVIRRIKITAVLEMEGLQRGRLNNEIDACCFRTILPPNFHVIDLYDKTTNNRMGFE